MLRMLTLYAPCPVLVSKLATLDSCRLVSKFGQDMLFIGPNDLALSILGYAPARGNEPEFNDAIEKIIAVARKHGKWIGRLSNDGASARKHLEIFDTVALGYDVRAIQNWYLAELKSVRSSQ